MMIKTKLQIASTIHLLDYVVDGPQLGSLLHKLFNVEVTFQLQSTGEITEKKLTTTLNDALDSFYLKHNKTKFDKGDLACFVASYLHNEYRVFLQRVITVKVFNRELPAVIVETY